MIRKATILINENNRVYNIQDLVNTVEGQDILKEAYKNNYKIFCICNGKNNPIKMYIRRINGIHYFRYLLCRNPYTRHLHHKECLNYDKNENSNIFRNRSNIVYEKIDNIFKENIWEGFNFRSNMHIDKNLIAADEKKVYMNIEMKRSKKGYDSLFSLGETILSNAWYIFVTNKNNFYNPREGQLFHTIYNKLNDYKRTDDKGDTINLPKTLFQLNK